MALEITANRHGFELAKAAQVDSANLVSGFQNTVVEVPEVSISNVTFPTKAFYLISAVGLCSSSSEARRKIQGNFGFSSPDRR